VADLTKIYRDVLELLHSETTGILSTHSLELNGYPFGSVTPFCLDDNFNPIILVSEIAQHTKNMIKDNKVSLTITESGEEEEKQSLGRYTCLADAFKIEKTSDEYDVISETYLRHYPQAKHYFEAHNFNFFRLNFVKGRFIKGFGKIHWIEKVGFPKNNNLDAEARTSILSHMNADHQRALRHYLKAYKGIEVKDDDMVNMIGIYQFGFDLLVNKKQFHFATEGELTDVDSARKILVEMSKPK